MNNKPASRKSNVVEQELEKEFLIYDLIINKAFCLNQTSALVCNLADGTKTVAEISDAMSVKLKTKVSEDFVWFALNELRKENLLENEAGLTDHFAGMIRREAIGKVGLSTMIALPIISSLLAPTSAMAQSAACPSGFGPVDPDGTLGNGSQCLCNGSGGASPVRACNTTRGGNGSSSANGCRAGCLCRSAGADAIANGTCG